MPIIILTEAKLLLLYLNEIKSTAITLMILSIINVNIMLTYNVNNLRIIQNPYSL